MSELTTYMNFTIPSENEDPFWESFVQMTRDLDKSSFMRRLKENMFIGDGGTVTFSSITGLLQWTTNFIIPIPHFGLKVSVVYGPDNLNRRASLADGSMLLIDVPYTMTANVTTNFRLATQLNTTSQQEWVAAIRIGSKVYFRGLAPL
jgi:hypothetical protein